MTHEQVSCQCFCHWHHSRSSLPGKTDFTHVAETLVVQGVALRRREQQEPTIDDALEGLGDLDPEDAVTPQEAGMRKSGGLQAIQPTPAKPLMVTAVGMQDLEDFHLRVCTIV